MLIRPKLEVFLMIEQALRAMNEAHWTYNDLPQLAYDPNAHEWFLLDFSASHHQEKWHLGDGDYFRMSKWYDLMELHDIAELRKRGQHVHHAIMLPDFNDPLLEPYNVEDQFCPVSEDERRKHVHLYVSTLRPLSQVWCRIEGTVFLNSDLSKKPRVHTWVASNHPLDDETIARYELTHAWSPWP